MSWYLLCLESFQVCNYVYMLITTIAVITKGFKKDLSYSLPKESYDQQPRGMWRTVVSKQWQDVLCVSFKFALGVHECCVCMVACMRVECGVVVRGRNLHHWTIMLGNRIGTWWVRAMSDIWRGCISQQMYSLKYGTRWPDVNPSSPTH